MTIINYGYDGEQMRGYIRSCGRYRFYWQLLGNTIIKCGETATYDAAISKCNAAAKTHATA